jgi:hypothetical protein
MNGSNRRTKERKTFPKGKQALVKKPRKLKKNKAKAQRPRK